MKKIVALLSTLFIVALPVSAKQFKVVTTFTVIQDIAQNVAGDKAVVESITKPGAEIHDYQPTPQDIVKAQSADLVLWNGMNLERWFERFFTQVKDKPAVVVTEGITPISIYEGPYKNMPNPHAWMSPKNALVYIGQMAYAYFIVHATADTFFQPILNNGELAALYSVVFLLFIFTGAGKLSLDQKLFGKN